MRRRRPGLIGAAAASAVTSAMVVLDLTEPGFRRWWAARPLTTDTVAGILVVLLTVLVVDQVVTFRQVRDRSRATAAQVAIVFAQATRSAQAVSSVLGGSGDREGATDEVRTYMTMLLIAAPVLIGAVGTRRFLEAGQHLGGQLARVMTTSGPAGAGADLTPDTLDESMARLRAAATPLLQVLDAAELAATGGTGATP